MTEPPYDADRHALAELAPRFAPLAPDPGTAAWLAAHARPHGALRTWFVQRLADFVSLYDAHGLTGSYPMHLLSRGQFETLLGTVRRPRLLDVGAGGGFVTAEAAPLFDEVVCTETSRPLARRLTRRGYRTVVGDLCELGTDGLGTFDVIHCLNVLDRTRTPRTLLARLRELATPETTLLVALPLPISAHVQVAGASVAPSERLPERARTWEAAALALTRELFVPGGFVVERLARLPYYSHGDRDAPLYVLDDALWVLRRAC